MAKSLKILSNTQKNLLIVDDEKGLRLGTQRLLEMEGYNVIAAENGTEGINLGTSNDFDLAIIDLKMPDIDGLEVLKNIKNTYPLTVCFIATAFASYDTAIEATRLGAFGYLPKPFTPEELLNQVEHGLNQRQLLLESEKLKEEREANLLELANEKSRLNTIIKAIADGVLVINRVGEVVYYNDTAILNLGIDSISIGEFALNKLPSKVTEIVKKYIKSDKSVQKSHTVELEIKPDNQLYVEAVCSPIPNQNGSLAGIVIVLRNITEAKKIEMIKSQFVSMVAHELKTPVAAVQGYLNIILDKSLNVPHDKQTEYLSKSVVRLKSSLALVNDLLDISRMELKTKVREIEPINISEIIKNTIQFLEIDINKKGLAVTTQFEKDLPAINADLNEISRLFTNIISNAVKYNKENGWINIEASESKNYLIIKIADGGIGLKPEEKQKLFNEFYRAKNEYTRGVSGTGLGLTIVKRIVESYHGKIEIESEYGIGTTFLIYLPINRIN